MAAKNVVEPMEVTERPSHVHFSASFGVQHEFNIYDEAVHLLDTDEMTLDGYNIKELFESSDSREIFNVVGHHGSAKLGEMDLEEWLVNRGFKGRTTKTMGHDDLEINDWDSMWMEKLMQGKRLEGPLSGDRLVRVEAFAVTIRNASAVGKQGLLHPLLKRWQAKACPIEMWGLPAIRAIVSFKWNHWAKKYVLVEFFLYLLWMVTFMAVALLYEEDELGKSFIDIWQKDLKGKLVVVLAFLCQIFMLPFTFIEINTMIGYGRQWANIWNITDTITQVLQILCTVIFLAPIEKLEAAVIQDTSVLGLDAKTSNVFNTDMFNTLLALQTILLIVKIQFFARAFVAVESSMLDMLKAVLRQIRWYLFFVLLTIYAFAVAFFILFREPYTEEGPPTNKLMQNDEVQVHKDPPYMSCEGDYFDSHPKLVEDFCTDITRPQIDFLTIYRAFFTMYAMILGSWEVEEYLGECPHQNVVLPMFSIYMLIMCVLLYNLMIAMMIDSHARQMEVRKLWVHLSRAQIIDELETSLPSFITKRHTSPFIHVLRIVPPKHASLESLWNQIGLAETSVTATKEDFELQLQATEKKAMELIENVSNRIRWKLGVTEEQYTKMLYSKLGISRQMTQRTLQKMKTMESPKGKLLTRLGTLASKRHR